MKTTRSLWAVGLGLTGWVLVGCADLIGIGQPPAATGGGGNDNLVDDPSGVRTRPECKTYCDDVMANCTGDFTQFSARKACVNACNTWELGTESEPTGNTVFCHADFADRAASSPDELCSAAGPAGIGRCGGKCAGWCNLLATGCPDKHDELANCEQACEALPVASNTFDALTMISGNSIECRIYHANAALESEEAAALHCTHANFMPDDVCIDDDVLTCEVYCQNTMGACLGENAVYESEEDCLATCAVFPIGTVDDKTQNTVGCRRYHSYVSLFDPVTHCSHAGPTGDGHCGIDDVDLGTTGPCASYCLLYEAACKAAFDLDFASQAECNSECPSLAGSAADAEYSVDTATLNDSLGCRAYYAVKVLGDAEQAATACPFLSPTAACLPAP